MHSGRRMSKKNIGSEFRNIIARECKRDGRGKFKTKDVLIVAERTYKEQQFVISLLKQRLSEMTMKYTITPCKKCGRDWSTDLIDTLYPLVRDRSEWVFGCMFHNGGCGRQVYGKSQQDVIERWNAGETDEWMRE